MADFLYILFREVLQIQQYPGSPFTGNPVQDVVQFFFIPMVFIIFFIYQLLGRMPLHGAPWLRLLFGLAIFLYMVINSWFAAFALFAGPYFLFLIIVLGLLYFIPSHFRRGEGGAPRQERAQGFPLQLSHRHRRGEHPIPTGLEARLDVESNRRMKELNEEIRETEADLISARAAGSKDEADTLRKLLIELKGERKRLLNARRFM
ncbi:MAG: hypothetical protein HYW25_01160 [Candidatus Aenigmarchaeota archaeon]|nr:hypothetical protein [Candidatus Aenigmarchaeota archaeon]